MANYFQTVPGDQLGNPQDDGCSWLLKDDQSIPQENIAGYDTETIVMWNETGKFYSINQNCKIFERLTPHNGR